MKRIRRAEQKRELVAMLLTYKQTVLIKQTFIITLVKYLLSFCGEVLEIYCLNKYKLYNIFLLAIITILYNSSSELTPPV